MDIIDKIKWAAFIALIIYYLLTLSPVAFAFLNFADTIAQIK